MGGGAGRHDLKFKLSYVKDTILIFLVYKPIYAIVVFELSFEWGLWAGFHTRLVLGVDAKTRSKGSTAQPADQWSIHSSSEVCTI